MWQTEYEFYSRQKTWFQAQKTMTLLLWKSHFNEHPSLFLLLRNHSHQILLLFAQLRISQLATADRLSRPLFSLRQMEPDPSPLHVPCSNFRPPWEDLPTPHSLPARLLAQMDRAKHRGLPGLKLRRPVVQPPRLSCQFVLFLFTFVLPQASSPFPQQPNPGQGATGANNKCHLSCGDGIHAWLPHLGEAGLKRQKFFAPLPILLIATASSVGESPSCLLTANVTDDRCQPSLYSQPYPSICTVFSQRQRLINSGWE